MRIVSLAADVAATVETKDQEYESNSWPRRRRHVNQIEDIEESKEEDDDEEVSPGNSVDTGGGSDGVGGSGRGDGSIPPLVRRSSNPSLASECLDYRCCCMECLSDIN